MGYGRLGAGMLDAFGRLGVETTTEEGSCDAAWWACLPNHIRQWRQGQRRYVTSMWEATHLPPGLHETIHEFDAVFVPSKQNVELFSAIHPNVVLAHLGIDPKKWHYQQRPPFDPYFNVYAPGQGARKGTDLAVKAFLGAFPKEKRFDPEPHLILKAQSDEGYCNDRFEHVNGIIPSGEEMALYEHAHVSLNLARGEGFGLFPLQSIAQGIPTILTDAHGHREFSHLGQGVDTTMSPAGRFLYGPAGDWWEPNLDEAIDLLRSVYEHYDAHLSFAKTASEVACTEFTWDKGARIIADEIGETGLLENPGEWEYTTRRKFLLRVSKYCDPFIGGTMYEFERNHDYYVEADLRRVLQDAGYLEPSCLDDQTGRLLTDEPTGVR